MKKVLLFVLFTILISFINVFAHEPGAPIKVKCFVSDVSVNQQMPPYGICFKDKHQEGYDELKASGALGCAASVDVGYSKGSHDLEKLRKAEKNILGMKEYDMKTEISFKDGKIFTSVSKFSTQFPGVPVQFSGEEMLSLYI